MLRPNKIKDFKNFKRNFYKSVNYLKADVILNLVFLSCLNMTEMASSAFIQFRGRNRSNEVSWFRNQITIAADEVEKKKMTVNISDYEYISLQWGRSQTFLIGIYSINHRKSTHGFPERNKSWILEWINTGFRKELNTDIRKELNTVFQNEGNTGLPKEICNNSQK